MEGPETTGAVPLKGIVGPQLLPLLLPSYEVNNLFQYVVTVLLSRICTTIIGFFPP